MVYWALGASIVALILGWRTARQNKELQDRVTQMNRRLYNLKRTLEELQTEVCREKTGLDFEIMKLQGRLNITGRMTVDEIKMLHPQAEQVLATHHIGGCAGCGADGSVRLAQAAAQNRQPLEPVLTELNNLVADSSGATNTSPARLKVSNVQLKV